VPELDKAGNAGILMNPHVAARPIYNSGMNIEVARKLSGRQDIAALASNENPNGCSPKVMEALRSALDPSRYSDPDSAALKSALSEFLSMPVDRIVIGNGSEDMIATVSRSVLVEGASAVTIKPSFGLHESDPLAAGARVRKVPMTAEMDFDVDALEAAIRNKPQLIILSSPSNPVGRALTHDQLARLAEAASPHTLFLLDEAYFEFTDDSIPDGIKLLQQSGKPYVVLRTFSKAYGLAGLRVGYAVFSNAHLAQVVDNARTPFNVNTAAQVAAIAALSDQSWMRASVEKIVAERGRLAQGLRELGLFVVPSQANFFFFRTPLDSRALFEGLLAEGIIVKPWREPGYETFVRASVGTPEENDRLIAALRKVLVL
jgi:histidinol-phosphate aminotransferase